MGSPLDHVLQFLTAHPDCYVFPVGQDKRPLFKGWQAASSNSPEQARKWAAQYPACNFALDCGKSEVAALDVDVKKGKPGLDSLTDLILMHGDLPETYQYTTPSGGHMYLFKGAWANSVEKIAPGLDTRGLGGYVLLPGGVVGGNEYRLLHNGGFAPLPDALARLVGKPAERPTGSTTDPLCELDTPAALARADDYLAYHAPVPDEGSRNDTAYKVAATLKNIGLSRDSIIERMLTVWNDRLDRPLDDDELTRTCDSAWRGSRGRPGSANPEAVFIALGVTTKRQAAMARGFRFLTLADIVSVPRPIRWLIRGYLEEDSLAEIFGDPGTMKSFLAIDMGLCIASGTPWHGHVVPAPGPVFYLAGEGFHGLSKRIKAWIVANDVDPAAVPFYVSNSPAQFLDATSARDVEESVAELAEKHGLPKLVAVDTLNRNFGPGDENTSPDMTAFVGAMDSLKARFGCAVLVVHHNGLQAKERARGSSVLHAALDFEYRLTTSETIRILENTKCKDHEPPSKLAFKPETVSTGWFDPDTGEDITSCVLRLTTTPGDIPQAPMLKGAVRIAYIALMAACERTGGACHVDDWRQEAYVRGISTEGQDAKRKAFSRATKSLAEAQLIKSDGESMWKPSWPGQPDKPDITRTCPDMSGGIKPDGQDTPL